MHKRSPCYTDISLSQTPVEKWLDRSKSMHLLPSVFSLSSIFDCLPQKERSVKDAWKLADLDVLADQKEILMEETFELFNVAVQLSYINSGFSLEHLAPTDDERASKDSSHKDFVAAWQYLHVAKQRVRYVEVMWERSVHVLPFIMPEIEEVAER